MIDPLVGFLFVCVGVELVFLLVVYDIRLECWRLWEITGTLLPSLLLFMFINSMAQYKVHSLLAQTSRDPAALPGNADLGLSLAKQNEEEL